MSRYRVVVAKLTPRQLRAIRDWRPRLPLEQAILALGDDPRPPGCGKLVGETDQRRVRVGDWRIVYRIDDGRLVVEMIRRGPRREVYR